MDGHAEVLGRLLDVEWGHGQQGKLSLVISGKLVIGGKLIPKLLRQALVGESGVKSNAGQL